MRVGRPSCIDGRRDRHGLPAPRTEDESMTVINGDILEIRQPSSWNDDFQFLNVFFVQVVTAPTAGDSEILTDLATWRTTIYTPILPDFPTTWDTDPATINNLTQDVFVGELAGELVGTGVGDVLPFQVAALVVGRTADRGHQARKYFGPFVEASNVDGIWVAGTQSNLVSAGVAWETDPVTSIDGLYLTGVYNTRELPTPIFRPIIGSRVIQRTRTQRSRTRKVRF